MQDAGRNTPEHNLTEYDIEQSTQPLWMPDIDEHMIKDPIDLQKCKQRSKIKKFSRLLAEVQNRNGDKTL